MTIRGRVRSLVNNTRARAWRVLYARQQSVVDGTRYGEGAHVVPNGPRDGYGDKYLRTVAESGNRTAIYTVHEHGKDKVESGNLRGFDSGAEAKRVFAQYSKWGRDGAFVIGRLIAMWQPGMPPNAKRDLEAFEPRHYNHYNADDYIDPATGESLGVIGSARAAARDYWYIIWPVIQQNPHVDVWGCTNEMSSHWVWQSDKFIELMKLADEKGIILCLGNYSSGNPPHISEPNDPRRYDVFDQWLPWLDYAGRNGHLFCTHEYAELGPLHVGRFIHMYERMEEKEIVAPKLVIGESGWVTFPGNGVFMATVKANEALYRQYPYLIGDCKFTYGKWINANIQTASKPFGQLLASVDLWPEATTPPDPGPEAREYARHVVLIPEDTTPMERSELNAKYASTVTRLTSADDAFIIPALDWPTQLVRLDVDLYDVERVANVEGVEEATQAIDNFIDTYHPVRETDTEFNLEYFQFGDTNPLPPLPPKFWLGSPVADVDPLVITSPFNAPRNYKNGLHEGVDLQSFDHAAGVARWAIAAQEGEIHSAIPWNSADPHLEPYGNIVVLRHPGPWRDEKIYYTWYCHLDGFAAGLEVGKHVEVGDKLGITGKSGSGTSEIHLHDMLQVYKLDAIGDEVAAGLSGYYIESVEDPTPLFVVEVDQPPTEPPTGNAWVGLHLLHDLNQHTVQAEIETIATGKIVAAKFNTNANIENGLPQLISSGVDMSKAVMRLYMAGDSQTLNSPSEFVNAMSTHLDWFQHEVRKTGVVGGYVEIHNEPNLTDEGFGRVWHSAQEFHAWLLEVVMELESRWPSLLWGYPGLSPQPEVNAWLDDLLSNGNLLNMLDWIGIHAYWVDAPRMFDPEHGGYYKRYVARFPDYEKLITEFSHKAAIKQGELSKGEQYVKYYAGLPDDIKAAYSYITVDKKFPLEEWAGKPIAETVGDR